MILKNGLTNLFKGGRLVVGVFLGTIFLLFGHEHIGHPMPSRARQFGSQCVGNEGHPLLFPADVDAAAPVCVEFEDAGDCVGAV